VTVARYLRGSAASDRGLRAVDERRSALMGCTCDDWAEFAQAREDMGLCGTHGNPKPCADCDDRRRRYDREREDER
jgi:hypothetical protein